MVRRALLVLLSTAPLLAAAPIAAIEQQSACCACPGTGAQALFCGAFEPGTELDQAADRCHAENSKFLCLAMELGDPSPMTCGAQLADFGINCPIVNGAPALGTIGLGALLIGLPALGFGALRRSAATRA